ncbi:hypothetical protein [Saccharospirillum salsuginis]|uniref:Uncharacterized protein n=1 Tax=Saccharospirillum salsuginis TaxID=418750 RepID=A0A918NFS2_9GAMM|nr:hypothetical protein [Saccharospirillum salsuginis]GGX69676.1 hypothetical protein GCM10007392_41590 [Saccharospirillum salsuginis]
MSIQLSGLERYQSHQQLGHTDAPQHSEKAASAGARDTTADLPEDDVSLSDAVALMEWIAHQAPDLEAPTASAPASLGRLSDQLLRFDMITLPEAGRLMSLAEGYDETSTDTPLFTRIGEQLEQSEHFQQKQEWQKLGRLVSNLAAAQMRGFQ